MRQLGKSKFCAYTFFGRSEDDGEKYGVNGLPVTPASIRILGRFQKLKALDHNHLCKYLDIQRGKYDRIFIIAEYNDLTLSQLIKDSSRLTMTEISHFSFHILNGLSYLHAHNLTHGHLSSMNSQIAVNTNGFELAEIWKMKQMIGVLTKILRNSHEQSASALNLLLEAVKLAKPSLIIPETLEHFREVIDQCLIVRPSARPSAADLLKSPIFNGHQYRKESLLSNLDEVFASCKRTADLTPQNFRKLVERISETNDWLECPISERPIDEVYCLWKLAGSNVETILKRMGLTKVIPPIKSIPQVVIEECEVFGREKSRRYLTDLNSVPLSLKNLEQRLKSVESERFFVSLEMRYASKKSRNQSDYSPTDGSSTCFHPLPTVVKERDIEYQLINAYPFKQAWLWKESRIDIPPLYRGLVWAALLNVRGDVSLVYDNIDKETLTSTDRQIEVDIPRCHQYDELLSSPEGHSKLKRILKAWVVSHPQYVYWQGLDSLSAPFLYLNFNNEALAFACLRAFIPRYLHKFFLKDNASVIQEYLAVFNHIVAFHDPELYAHLRHIDFIPELYAIPWFLTMFAHVFPLHKLFHLWDTLLLGDSSFPLCVGVSILLQLRDRLMHYGFNECILLFSDLPEIDIARCVEDSVKLFVRTPKSATYRQHALGSDSSEYGLDKLSGRQRNHVDQRGGSFTEDLSQLTQMPELGMNPIPLAKQKAACCPRISAAELIQLMEAKSKGIILKIHDSFS